MLVELSQILLFPIEYIQSGQEDVQCTNGCSAFFNIQSSGKFSLVLLSLFATDQGNLHYVAGCSGYSSFFVSIGFFAVRQLLKLHVFLNKRLERITIDLK